MGKVVSLIATVLNEQDSVGRLLETVATQTRLPDEIVIVDGGSGDGTVETILGYASRLPIRVIITTGCNISKGRNTAIAAASGRIIVSTDAGVRLSPNWLADLVRPIESGECEVVSGFFLSDPQTTFETALGLTVLPLVDEIDPKEFLPSSRSVAFLKSAWKKAGKYPEWLDFCEDLIFDLNLRKAGVRFGWAPEAIAYFRPRSNLRAFYKQYFQYARGDGKANLWIDRHVIRYATYFAAPTIYVAGYQFHPLWLLLAIAVVVYLSRPYRRLVAVPRFWPVQRWLVVAAWIPVIRATGDIAKMIGYPVGVLWRIRQRPEVRGQGSGRQDSSRDGGQG